MHDITRALSKPHYAFRPAQLLRRGRHSSPIRLPWGLPLEYDATGFVGGSLARTGVYDLVVTEALWRLIEPGDFVIDAGANIGYMTSIMARRVGRSGRVDAFEPHPDTFRQLKANAARWDAPVVLHNAALTDAHGSVELFTAGDDDANHSQASLAALANSAERITVNAVTLDETLTAPARVMKIDVEGSELLALRGAERTLESLVHIVYEDLESQPSSVTRFLQEAGFTILLLEERFFGPKAHRDVTRPRSFGWDAPSLVATRSLPEAEMRLSGRGWRCLNDRSRES